MFTTNTFTTKMVNLGINLKYKVSGQYLDQVSFTHAVLSGIPTCIEFYTIKYQTIEVSPLDSPEIHIIYLQNEFSFTYIHTYTHVQLFVGLF